MVGLPTALYYRDLFVHRLGATTADRGFLLLVDGQVMTAFGIFIQDFLQFRVQYLPEIFGITRSSIRYKRLGKLFMLLLTSGEMKKRLCDILKLWLHEPAGIQTTSITVHEEGKTDRGAVLRQNAIVMHSLQKQPPRDRSLGQSLGAWISVK